MIYKFQTENSGIGFNFDVEFEQNQKINCIIGKNGIGKTQLLENMAKVIICSKDLEGSKIYENNYISKNILLFEKEFASSTVVNNLKFISDKKIIRPHRAYSESHPKQEGFKCFNPIVFIGAQNRGFTKNINTQNIKILSDSEGRFEDSIIRTLNYLNGNGLENEEIANWFVSRLIVNPNFVVADQDKTHEVITVLKLIERLEPSLKLVSKNKDDSNNLNILYHEGQLLINNVALDKLSTGFVSIIKIFQEIVAGYGGWSNINDLSQVDGIVFIDEIEPHLHISWQTKIIGILKEFFPKTTFYISTHSPLVLSGLKDGEAYELYQEEKTVKTKKIENIDNYFLNDIVKEFFDVDLNREKIDNPNKEKHNKAKSMLLDLAKTLSEDTK